ncbi:hypothetical protein GCM10012275_07810 [Longimycelium tulufanense]|uniref:PD-(D/E)XK endonuclease-like domain-containing protein n=1 Tax=Longimycelium tulufanense TaxID=907463 RepID=A0A8J3C9H3_9PSEU|nr:hypothetical protein GCM10012275_07810 [Longimycelium tulufanense]
MTHRSVSQRNEYRRCGWAYYLGRVAGVWARPASWTVQGTAFHAAVEAYEKSRRALSGGDVRDLYRKEYAAAANALCVGTPNFEYWFGSGPYDGERDLERRYAIGLEQVDRYLQYVADTPEESIWEAPDGTLAVELKFEIDLDGVLVRGYIDQVVRQGNEKLRVRDLKTGRQPGDDFQLAVYTVALGMKYGVDVTTGDYWMARVGKATHPYELRDWTTERITEEFHKMDQAVKAGRFEPDPEPNKCRFCPVNSSCEYIQ